jgi:hypothetical protein
MKMIQARKMLEKYPLRDMVLIPGLQDAELSRRLEIRNRAIKDLMDREGITYIQSYTLVSQIIRRHLHNRMSGQAGNRKEWRQCGVCGRPAYTTIANHNPLCKEHLATVNMHKKRNYLRRLKMLGKVRMNKNRNKSCSAALHVLLCPVPAMHKCAASSAGAAGAAVRTKLSLLKIEVLNKLEQLIDIDTSQKLVLARINRSELYQVMVDEIVARLEGEFDHPRQVLEANILYYINSKEEFVWKQEMLF